jgi:hypothetical protein
LGLEISRILIKCNIKIWFNMVYYNFIFPKIQQRYSTKC